MSLLERVHQSHVASRRVRVLLRHLQDVIPCDASVLDVGCGDGELTAALASARDDIQIQGVDVLVRPDSTVRVTKFDGQALPFDNGQFDVVLFVDVLHHTDDPLVLLREASRVARRAVVLKDHLLQGPLAGPTLRLMDRVGNARHGVALPFKYWRRDEWDAAFAELHLTVDHWRPRLGLYWWPASLIFDRSLHFIGRLNVH